MQVISIISTKGGEGKSTHAANLSGFLADAGLKTLLIDGDYAQPTASSYYSLRYEAPCGLYLLRDPAAKMPRLRYHLLDHHQLGVEHDHRRHFPDAA